MIFHCLYKKLGVELRRAFKFPLECEKTILPPRFPVVTNYGTNTIRLTFRLYGKNVMNPFTLKSHKAKNGIVTTIN